MLNSNLYDLENKTVLITGAGSGIGKSIAIAMAEAGANLILIDKNDVENKNTLKEVIEIGVNAYSFKCDVSDEYEVLKTFSYISEFYKAIDVAFLNAGVADSFAGKIHEVSFDDWKKVIDVNLHGVFLTSKETLKRMLPNKKGKIILTGSIWGLRGSSSIFPLPAYTASKAAVLNLTREMALEYASCNIQVNSISPGFIETNIANGVYESAEIKEKFIANTPMGRLAKPSEVKGLANFLASDSSSFITGSNFVIDGGALA